MASVTHEYIVAVGGRILLTGALDPAEPTPTAIAWAGDRVLAVGPDDAVRAISRGDSAFLDLDGCAVTPLPDDPALAERRLGEAAAATPALDVAGALTGGGLVPSSARLEPGSPADLAFWSVGEPDARPAGVAAVRLVAVVRAGAFESGDEHRGPFRAADAGSGADRRP
jgi:hypothetical protein